MWIKTKARLQMAETIIRYLPRVVVCLEEIAKSTRITSSFKYKDDLLKLVDEMDIRKQENINLKFEINRLEQIIENRK